MGWEGEDFMDWDGMGFSGLGWVSWTCYQIGNTNAQEKKNPAISRQGETSKIWIVV